MLKNQLITPEGTKDFLFEEAAVREEVETLLHTLFKARGFSEVITPGLEFLDVFSVKGHSIPVEYMYKLSDHKGRLMVLRPDSTMPIARLWSTRLRSEQLPLRLSYNQTVYSQNRTLTGRSDEVKQAGVELIGAAGLRADLEMTSLSVQALQRCRQQNFRIEIGHIGIFNALVDALGLDDAVREQLRLYIEAKNYPALNDLLDTFGSRHEAGVLKQLPRLFGGDGVFPEAEALLKGTDAEQPLSYLRSLYSKLDELGLGDCVTVDLGIVNRTDYYTGIVFKGYIEGHGEEVLSGGRYDRLVGQYGEETPAIGFAVNVDAVARALLRNESAERKATQVLVFADTGCEIEALHVLDRLVDEGRTVEFATMEELSDAVFYAEEKEINEIVQVTPRGLCMHSVKEGI